MKPISWKSYYDKFYDWEESTQKNYSNRLSDFGPAEFDDEETILPPVRSPGLLTTLLAAFAFSGSGKKRDSGRCDGDCAHCPLAYIAGYTSGGAAYGLQWEDVGIDPDLPFDEKVRLYRSGTY